MKQTIQPSLPGNKRYCGMTTRRIGTLAIIGVIFCFILVVLSACVERTPEIIIDVPSFLGSPMSGIRSLESLTIYEDLHPLLGYEDILPNGTLSEAYSSGNYSFYIFYDKNRVSVGFQIFDGLESRRLKVGRLAKDNKDAKSEYNTVPGYD